ncbi:MAG: PKD domain-containing protein, partial [Thermoplasmata archaeon]
VYTNEIVTFNGILSRDVDGFITDYNWTFYWNNTPYYQNGMIANFTYPNNGVYIVVLTVKDDDNATASASTTVTVLNRPPVLVMNVSTTSPQRGETVTFDATECYDSDGTITNITWFFGDGEYLSGVRVNHSYNADGIYYCLLMITDDDGAMNTSTVRIKVGNKPPVAVATAQPVEVFTGEPVNLSANDSYDPDDPFNKSLLVNYTWRVLGEPGMPVKYGMNINMTFPTGARDYTIELTVTDTDGGRGSTIITITVKNRPPVPIINAPPGPYEMFTQITFNGESSFDYDGNIVYYLWYVDSTSTVYTIGPTLQYTFTEFRPYTIYLNVTDNNGASAWTSYTALVQNQPPVAFFRILTPEEERLKDTNITFDITGTSDYEGPIMSLEWRWGDGIVETTTNVNQTRFNHSYENYGNYTVLFIVTDNMGATSEYQATISIIPYNYPPVIVFTHTTMPAGGYYANTPINFSAYGSYDPNDPVSGPLYYQWVFSDGPVYFTMNVSRTFTRYGNYSVVLTITDAQGARNTSAPFNFTVRNPPPVATIQIKYGPLQQISTEDTITVPNGTVYNLISLSYDPDGMQLSSITWTLNGENIGNSAYLEQRTFDRIGTMVIVLTVTDDLGLSSTDTLTVTVENLLPEPQIEIADVIAGSQLYTKMPITFSANRSRDPDGTLNQNSFVWNIPGVSPNPRGSYVTVRFDNPGNYTIRLDVTDRDGGFASAYLNITIRNSKPVPVITFNQPAVIRTFDILNFSSANSYDVDGQPLTFTWSFGDLVTVTTSNYTVQHSYQKEGTYTIILYAVDSEGAADSASLVIKVDNRPPVAKLDVLPKNMQDSGEPVTFIANNSTDPDGVIVEYRWRIEDTSGTSLFTHEEVTSEPVFVYIFRYSGRYNIT